MRQCCDCGETKPITEFANNKANSIGKDYFCKTCKVKKKEKYYRSKEGVIQTIWDSQKLSCKHRGHSQPLYTKNQLKEWILNHPEFDVLYNNWVKSGYDRLMKPSIDRLDDFRTYSFDNIRLVVFKTNHIKAYENRHNAVGTQGALCKAVLQYDLNGNFIAEYPSAELASKEVPNTNRQNIQKVCHNERHTCGGFVWKFKI